MFRRRAWYVMTFLALAVAAYAVSLLVVPDLRAPFVRERLTTIPLIVYAHFLGSAVALGLGPFQFLASLRARALAVHRWMGRLYVSGCVLGGLGGLVMATVSDGGPVAHVGFAALAVIWVGTAGAAYLAIREGDVLNHRRWVTRSFALALAAVTLRLELPLMLAAGVSFSVAYPIVAWLCWVPNLFVAEWRFVPASSRRTPATA